MKKRDWWIVLIISLGGISLCVQQLGNFTLIETLVIFAMLCIFVSIGGWGITMSKYMDGVRK